jgi:transposase
LLNKVLNSLELTTKNYDKIRYWCQDESRFGLITMRGKKLTGLGVQPVGVEQLKYDYLWLYGLVEPKTGESFFYEFCHLDTVCFEKYLELFSEKYPDDLHIIQLDNGGFHQAFYLSVPDNIVLLFQPSYSPQTNPIERLWKEMKKLIKWQIFDDLDDLRLTVSKILEKLTPEIIQSVTGWDFILSALSTINI